METESGEGADRAQGKRSPPRHARQIVLIYLAIGVLWVLLSDTVLDVWAPSQAGVAQIQSYKGLFYVLVTAALLYLLIGRSEAILVAERQELAVREEVASTSPAAIMLFDTGSDGTDYASGACEEIFGYTPDELTTMGSALIHRVVHPDDLAALRSHTRQTVANWNATGLDDLQQFEFRIIRKDGAVRWMASSRRPFRRADDGQVTKTIGVYSDQTELQQTLDQLRLSEDRFRRVVEDQTEFILRWLPDGTRTFVNDSYCNYHGIIREEVLGTSFFPQLRDENRAVLKDQLETLTPEHPITTFELRVNRPDGREGWTRWTHRAIFSDTRELIEYQSVGQDISDRRMLEDTLRLVAQQEWTHSGEQFFGAIAQYVGTAFEVEYVIVGRLADRDRAVESVAFYAAGELAPPIRYDLRHTPCEQVVGHTLCLYPEGVQALFPLDSLLGEMKVEAYVGIPLWDSKGQPIGLMAVMDIKPMSESTALEAVLQVMATRVAAELERVRSDEVLRAREADLRNAQAMSQTGSFSWDLTTGEVAWTDEMARLLWCEGQTPSYELYLTRVHPDDREQVESKVRELRELGTRFDLEYRILGPDGTVRWVQHGGSDGARDTAGRLVRIQGTCHDITEHRRVEEAIREGESSIRALFEARTNGVFLVDTEGRVLISNEVGARRLNTTPDEILGASILDFFPEVRETRRAQFEQVIDTRQAAEFSDTRAGRTFHVSLYPVLDGKGNVSRIAIYVEEITQRVKAEESLKAAFAEIQQLKDQLEAENVYLRQEIQMSHLHGDMVGQSKEMNRVHALAERVAPTDSTVLILGDTGTGKELLARAIHTLSDRKERPLVTVNCAAMPGALVENELFGREKGAYTGALTRQKGRFEIADGGTLFLDEIGELPLETQAKLLRVLQEGQFEKLGSADTISVDVRLIAATNRDLQEEVRKGNFREDLFYRLNVFPITIPPLTERREDIEPLVWAFIVEFSEKMGKRIESISASSLESLKRHSWPGNVRELRNVIERAMIQSEGRSLQIPLAERPTTTHRKSGVTLDEVQRAHILEILEETGWRVRGSTGAAAVLGLNPSTLESRMVKLGIRRPAPNA